MRAPALVAASLALALGACVSSGERAADPVANPAEESASPADELEALGALLTASEDAALQEALARLRSPELLLWLALHAPSDHVRGAALRRLDDPTHLHRIALEGPAELRAEAIARLSNRAWLRELVESAERLEDRLAALERLEAPELLARIASEPGELAVRRAALRRVADPALHARIARGREPEALRVDAVLAIDAAEVLESLVPEGRRVGRVAALRLALAEPSLARRVEVRFEPGPLTGEDGDPAEPRVELRSRTRGETLFALPVTATLDVPALCERLFDRLGLGPQELAPLAGARSRHLRLACVRHGLDPEALHRVCLEDPVAGLRVAAMARVEDARVLAEMACGDALESVALTALGRLEDPESLVHVALEASRESVRRRATQRVRDPAVLARIALEDPRGATRAVAVRQLADPALLARIARADEERTVRYNAVATLSDRAELQRLVDEGGTEGGLAACRLALLDLEPEAGRGRLRMRIDRGADDVLYRPGPDPIRIQGEWVLGVVVLDPPEGAPGRRPVRLCAQEWAMPRAISLDEAQERLEVRIDPEAFRARVRAALEELEAVEDGPASEGESAG